MPISQGNSNSLPQTSSFEHIMHFPGSIVGNRYQIIQKLGREESKKTYLAKDMQATGDARCVLQQLNVTQQGNQESSRQIIEEYLQQEMILLQRLGDHPQIPNYYNYFDEQQQFYIVREYIDGDNLEQEIERKIFDEAKTIHLIQDVLRILDFIHKTNVAHLDIQPIHLVRRKQDNLFNLINFGSLRQLESLKIIASGKIACDMIPGNWPYMAPEQKAGRGNTSSDIYALAQTAIYALTGKSPQNLEQTNLKWSEQCRISSKLEAILTKMLSPAVEQRYDSALQVLHDLRPLSVIGQTLGGRYLVTGYLGGQGKIDTYLADNLHRQYQSPCLVKQIEMSPHGEKDSVRIDRSFSEELTILERLGFHEQIPQLWDHFEENECFYLVQEYIRGENLAQKIIRQELSAAQIIQILTSTLSALNFVHQNRIIHRNIKPSNLLIRDHDRQVILTDFGLEAELETLPDSTTTNHHQELERQNYFPPEQLAGRPTISSDIYALGMTIIEALTNTKPISFPRDQTGKLQWADNIDSLNLDRRLQKIIDKMIQPDLGQRYRSTTKPLEELIKINSSGRMGRVARPSLRTPQNKAFSGRRGRRLPLLIGFLGVTCLAGSIEFAFPHVRPLYYWHQGQSLLAKQPQAALNKFTKAIDLKPQSWLAWSGRGEALAGLKRYPQALEAFTEAVQLNQNQPSNWINQGKMLFQLERYSQAIAKYNQALELAPEDVAIYNLKGQALYQIQQYQAALEIQDKALAQDSFNPQFLSDRAQNLLLLGRHSEALSAFSRVESAAPLELKLWQEKPLVLEALNRPQEAERVRREINNAYIMLLQEQPQNAQLWLAQGDFFAQSRMFPKALDSYEQVLELNPNDYNALLNKGQVLTAVGRTAAALEVFDLALQVRPQSYMALQGKGIAYQSVGDLSQAIASFDQGIAINSKYPPLWRDRGLILNQQQKYSQAISSFTQATMLTSHDAQVWQGLATAWNAQDQMEQALSAITKAIEIKPQSHQYWSQKGLIYTNNQQYNEACTTYRQSRAIAGNSSIIMSAMRQIGCRLN